jgi:hypothetical protein
MEIYRHKASGKYFIFIDYAGHDSGLFVNPIAKIMELEFAQFDDDPLENTGEYFFGNGLLTDEQVKHYQMYQDFRKQDKNRKNSEIANALIDSMSKEELKQFAIALKNKIREKNK